MRYGYVFSSLEDTAVHHYVENLREAKCEMVFADLTGSGLQRPELGKLMALLEPGDVLHLARLEQLASGLAELLDVLTRLGALKVDLVTLDGAVDTRLATSASFFAHAAQLADCGRKLAVARMQAGRSRARGRGLKLGRKPKLNEDQIAHGRKLLALGETGRAVARTLGISEATLYRHLKGQGQAR